MRKQSPILLALFSVLPEYSVFPIVIQLIYIVADLLGAHALMRIAQSEESTSSRLYTSARKESKASDLTVAAAYGRRDHFEGL